MNKKTMQAVAPLLVFVAAWLTAPPSVRAQNAGQESVAPTADTLVLPLTIERVWYRTGKNFGFSGASKSGDLVIDETALTLTTRKGELDILFESLHTISFGKLRGDVNTDWVVLAVVDEQGRRLVGLRDGRKFGYGQKTNEIYETLLVVARKLGAAQYDVPEGFETFDNLPSQYLLALPRGWSAHARSLTETGDQSIMGALVFSPRSLAPDPGLSPEERDVMRRKALEEVDSGRSGAIFVERREALSGMRCKGFSDKAVAKLLAWVRQDRIFAGAAGVEESTHTEPVTVDGCVGLRILRRVRLEDGEELILDLRAASDDVTVILFGLRSRTDRYETDLPILDTVMESVRFPVARR